jgi:hypothetical protein
MIRKILHVVSAALDDELSKSQNRLVTGQIADYAHAGHKRTFDYVEGPLGFPAR